MTKRMITGSIGAISFLVLILDGKTAMNGVTEGLQLCIRTVIPALFPFFVLSVMVTGTLTGSQTGLLRPLGRLLRIPPGSETLLLTGLLGGYPVGAQTVAQAWECGQLTRSDAVRMLGFCSNCGPSFLFGIVASRFSEHYAGWILWGIHILSAILTGILLPGGSTSPAVHSSIKKITLTEALERSIRITANVCGWVIVFRVMISFLDRWFFWFLPEYIRVILCGALELTNGSCQLNSISDPALRFLICAGILSFGGICVTMQTISVTQKLGLGCYLPGKLLQTAVSIVLAGMALPVLEANPIHFRIAAATALFTAAAAAAVTVIYHLTKKKTVAIP